MTHQDPSTQHLPACVVEYINHVIRRMRYSRSARREVKQELLDHFTDALADCPDPQQRQKLAEQMIGEFGDAKLLATLLRRAKKRNRPPWLKTLDRLSQAFLVLLLGVCLYAVWITLGRTAPRVDYLAELNNVRKPMIRPKDNAWTYFDRAIALYKKSPGTVSLGEDEKLWPQYTEQLLGDLSEPERAALQKWIDENEPAWQEYVLASKAPYCWVPYTTERHRGQTDTLAINMQLPPLGKIRSMRQIGVWLARLQEEQGQYEQAFQTCLTMLRVARHWQRPDDILVPQLTGTAIARTACSEIICLLATGKMSPATLAAWQQELAAVYSDGYPLLTPDAERYFFLDCVQYTYTDSGPGGGHLIPRQAIRLLNDTVGVTTANGSPPKPSADNVVTQFVLALAALPQVGRDEMLRQGNAIYDLAIEQSRMTPYQRRKTRDIDEVTSALPLWRYAILKLVVPSLSRAPQLSHQSRAEYEAALAILALKRYRAEHGQYPAALDELVAQHYLDQVPMDPYSPDPLCYKRNGDDFTLYSVAEDFQDDGGISNPDFPWDWWQSGSDRVFWPVPPLKPFPTEAEPVQGALGG